MSGKVWKVSGDVRRVSGNIRTASGLVWSESGQCLDRTWKAAFGRGGCYMEVRGEERPSAKKGCFTVLHKKCTEIRGGMIASVDEVDANAISAPIIIFSASLLEAD